jgi:hypothetical protein
MALLAMARPHRWAPARISLAAATVIVVAYAVLLALFALIS